ncbi:MAG: iron-containing alcohol dehydrogenase [Alphaproteobacteria bacterium]|nr:iron-containing alcohol dehydrogenase [Alphaproteobacteria bacterium]MBU0794453.1 iron-containing alcohol dehydrogenase [Alphaproteobacteria bacterium]MBU0876497.1 iron-containing alcohol dehydrogenase [Alphaproteobacteria bacterium]MBU1768323.1 iron-containing alcohol dehydrogenase [Alphaproteobacteria bacterium]
MQSEQLLSLHNVRSVRIGAGLLRQCAEDIVATGASRALIVSAAPLRALSDALAAELERAGCAPAIFDAIAGEPTFADFNAAMDMARTHAAGFIVGLGGGSAMDVAKLVAALMDGAQQVEDVIGTGLLHARAVPLACIPTTAGTGSEVTPIAILEDSAAELKKGVVSDHLVPDFAYLDAALTVSMPRAVTAATGLDALTHCIEAYANRFSHPVVDAWALEGIRLVAGHLERACADGNDLEARDAMLRAAHLGGMCLGPVNTAAVHALAYPLGGEFHIAHGVANSLLLPHVLRFNLPAAPARYAQVASALGVTRTGDDASDALAGIAEIERLSAAIGIERRLSAFGIGANAVPKMAAAAMTVQRLLMRNPREVTESDARAIYEAAL